MIELAAVRVAELATELVRELPAELVREFAAESVAELVVDASFVDRDVSGTTMVDPSMTTVEGQVRVAMFRLLAVTDG